MNDAGCVTWPILQEYDAFTVNEPDVNPPEFEKLGDSTTLWKSQKLVGRESDASQLRDMLFKSCSKDLTGGSERIPRGFWRSDFKGALRRKCLAGCGLAGILGQWSRKSNDVHMDDHLV